MSGEATGNPRDPAENAPLLIHLPSGRVLEIVSKQDAPRFPHEPEKRLRIIDDRRTGNPSMQIVASHRIHGRARMGEIIDALLAFDRDHPTDPPWQRTRESLLGEWRAHNLAYRLHVLRDRAKDVDLDNRDEKHRLWNNLARGVSAYLRPLARRIRAFFDPNKRGKLPAAGAGREHPAQQRLEGKGTKQ